MNVTVTRFVRFENDGALKAFCDVTIGESLLIKGIRIVHGKHGPFVSMPRQQSKNGKWYDSVVPLTKDIKGHIHRVVLEAFKTHELTGSEQEDGVHHAAGS